MSAEHLDLSRTAAFLREHDCFLLLTHVRPDGDTLGSAAALTRILRAMGKQAWTLENPGLTDRYRFLLEGLTAPADYIPETVLSVDVADASLLPTNAAPFLSEVALSIDHHGSFRSFSRRLLVSASAAAAGELVFALADALDVPLTPEIADALYAAISTDTGCFRFTNTTAVTHTVAAALMDAGARVDTLNKTFFETRARSQIAIESAMLQGLRYYAGGQAVTARLTKEMLLAAGATEDDLENIAGLPRTIAGVRVAMTISERKEGLKLSIRSDGVIRACDVCAKLGGGGHAAAAGAMLQGTMEEAETQVLRALLPYAEDLPWNENEIRSLR